MILNVFREDVKNDRLYTYNLEETDSIELKRIKELLDETNLEYVSANIRNILGITTGSLDFLDIENNYKEIKHYDMYRVILYMRLSIEDGDLIDGDVSKSIRNQLLFLLDECKKRNWTVVAIFCEDGISGADDNRPEWMKSLKYCEQKRTEIVLCKSQSRFSRSMEMIEKYLHKEFANWNIRFVGLVDSTDTSVKGNKKTRQINGLVNEWQVEDQSINTRAILRSKKSNGLYATGFAPYGYIKDPKDKYHLVIDEEAAKVIRWIFDRYIKGDGYHKIKMELNEKGVPCPVEYKRLHNSKFYCNNVDNNKVINYQVEVGDTIKSLAKKYYSTTKDIVTRNSIFKDFTEMEDLENIENQELEVGTVIKIPSRPIWSNSSVRVILMNETYTGCIVLGKVERKSYKDKTAVNVDKDRWIRVPHCHEPIIDKETWEMVIERFSMNGRFKSTKEGTINIFSKKVYCACCGKIFNKTTNRGVDYLQCKNHRETAGHLCNNNKSIRTEQFGKILLEKINEQILKYYDLSEIEKDYYKQKINSSVEKDIKGLNDEKNNINKKLDKKANMLNLLYDDRANGVIDANEFVLLKNRNDIDIQTFKDRLISINNEILELEKAKKIELNKEKLFQKYKKIDKLDRFIIDEFISKVYVGEVDEVNKTRDIEIIWNIRES